MVLTLLFTVNGSASAVGTITATDHEGQLKPSGTYANGNTTIYAELESINFRFALTAGSLGNGDVSSGKMEVRFDRATNKCDFFDGTFVLGTHDGSATPVEAVVGTPPTVTLESISSSGTGPGSHWIATLDVQFVGDADTTTDQQARVNYYLTLTDNVGFLAAAERGCETATTAAGPVIAANMHLFIFAGIGRDASRRA